jgi:hypothetical protein
MNETGHSVEDPPWRPLALSIGLVAIALAIVFRLPFLPPELRPWNLAPIGAMCLYAGGRMRLLPALALPLLAMGLTDLALVLTKGDMYKPSPFVYASFGLYILLGRWLLSRSESAVRIGFTALAGSAQFFLITNFGAWLDQVQPYGPGLDGLMKSYEAGLPFYRGTLLGDVFFSAAFFGVHTCLARAYFPAEQVHPAAAVLK